MKVFVNVGKQIYNEFEDNNQFCFYCTVLDKFESFSDELLFETLEQFESHYDGDDIERYVSLIPSNFNNNIKRDK